MIVLTISDRIKPVPFTPVVYNSPHLPATTPNNEVYQEVLRKDKIIKELVAAFKHPVGAEVEPKSAEHFLKWGKCKILGICSEYIHLEKDFKWPKGDNPMIVTACSEAGEIFYATTNFFKE